MTTQQVLLKETDIRATLRGIAHLIALQVSELERQENANIAHRNKTSLKPLDDVEYDLIIEDSLIPESERLGTTYDQTITVSHKPLARRFLVSQDNEDEDDVNDPPRFQVWLCQSYPTTHGVPKFTLICVNSSNQLVHQDGMSYPNWNEMMDHMGDYSIEYVGVLIKRAAEFLINGYTKSPNPHVASKAPV